MPGQLLTAKPLTATSNLYRHALERRVRSWKFRYGNLAEDLEYIQHKMLHKNIRRVRLSDDPAVLSRGEPKGLRNNYVVAQGALNYLLNAQGCSAKEPAHGPIPTWRHSTRSSVEGSTLGT